MKRSQRLTRIVQLSQTAEQIAAQAHAAAQREVTAREAQLRALQGYREEYLKRLAGGASLPGYDAEKLRVFLHKLEAAISGQNHQLAASRRRCERERLKVIAQKRRVNVLQEAASRARGLEARRAEARLQHEIDDLPRLPPHG
jgi:flagellar export protein FliJ